MIPVAIEEDAREVTGRSDEGIEHEMPRAEETNDWLRDRRCRANRYLCAVQHRRNALSIVVDPVRGALSYITQWVSLRVDVGRRHDSKVYGQLVDHKASVVRVAASTTASSTNKRRDANGVHPHVCPFRAVCDNRAVADDEPYSLPASRAGRITPT